MGAYREMVAEKVLDKTLGNRLGRIVESTVSKLEAKISEESMVKKTAEDQWKRTALQETVDYFDDESVRRDFMRDALAQFCSGDTAKISNMASSVEYKSDIFASERSGKAASEKADIYEQKVSEWASIHNPVN